MPRRAFPARVMSKASSKNFAAFSGSSTMMAMWRSLAMTCLPKSLHDSKERYRGARRLATDGHGTALAPRRRPAELWAGVAINADWSRCRPLGYAAAHTGGEAL